MKIVFKSSSDNDINFQSVKIRNRYENPLSLCKRGLQRVLGVEPTSSRIELDIRFKAPKRVNFKKLFFKKYSGRGISFYDIHYDISGKADVSCLSSGTEEYLVNLAGERDEFNLWVSVRVLN